MTKLAPLSYSKGATLREANLISTYIFILLCNILLSGMGLMPNWCQINIKLVQVTNPCDDFLIYNYGATNHLVHCTPKN